MTMKTQWISAVCASAAVTGAQDVRWIGEPQVVAQGIVSTEYRDVRATVSPDGQLLLWGSSNRPGGAGGYDIWLARRVEGAWRTPEPVSFNTKDKEFDPAFSPDGRFVYFFSNRPGGLGGDDVYRVPVTQGRFGTVENLGAVINGAGNEWAPTLSPDGRTLIFCSDGRTGKGRQDLFVSHLANGRWSEAQPLPGAVNSPGDEFDAAFLSDNITIVYSHSSNIENEPVTLKIARRGASGYEAGSVLPFSGQFQYAYGPELDWHEPGVLYFAGVPAGSKASADIYAIRYQVTAAAARQ